MRLRIDVSYEGYGFHGWASQPGLRTVQGELEEVLTTIIRQPVVLTVAGRTDAGVHALGQCAHFDVDPERFAALGGRSGHDPAMSLRRRANAMLVRRCAGIRGYSDVIIRHVRETSPEFDARFSALWRAYTYRIADQVELWDPRQRDVLWCEEELDIAAMNRAAEALLGEHDFLAYCKPRPGASTIRTLHELYFSRDEAGVITGYARADAFCHSQVRTMIGTLIRVGSGKREESWPGQRLRQRCRDGEVVVAPAHPLTLAAVGYPDPARYGEQARIARQFRGADGEPCSSCE
ncbi:tRNA pseudouridine(38-40) synthase TruA [Trueperella sp. LYQ141]|uniref:tRNA pseudouridine(38-40) synthase TruA n=1 Tax=Trueperella sp. LYQ141 TaxID=3391058 RepID=UPI003983067D